MYHLVSFTVIVLLHSAFA